MARKLKKFEDRDIRIKMKKLPLWDVNKRWTEIQRTFKFDNYINTLAFAAKVLVHAEVLDHHPDMLMSYGKLTLKIKTHEVKGLTKKDFELAKRIDKLSVH